MSKNCPRLSFSLSILLSVEAKAWSTALPTEQTRPFPHPRSCLRRCKESHGSHPEGRYDKKNDLSSKIRSAESNEKVFTRPNSTFNWVHLSPQRHSEEKCLSYFVHRPDATDWQCVYPQWEACLVNLVLLEEGLVRARKYLCYFCNCSAGEVMGIHIIVLFGNLHRQPTMNGHNYYLLQSTIKTKSLNIKVKEGRYKSEALQMKSLWKLVSNKNK